MTFLVVSLLLRILANITVILLTFNDGCKVGNVCNSDILSCHDLDAWQVAPQIDTEANILGQKCSEMFKTRLRLHGVTAWKETMDMFTAMKTSDIKCCYKPGSAVYNVGVVIVLNWLNETEFLKIWYTLITQEVTLLSSNLNVCYCVHRSQHCPISRASWIPSKYIIFGIHFGIWDSLLLHCVVYHRHMPGISLMYYSWWRIELFNDDLPSILAASNKCGMYGDCCWISYFKTETFFLWKLCLHVEGAFLKCL